MAYIKQIEPDEAEGLLKRIYDSSIKRAGGVANIVKVMGLDARSMQGSMQFYTSLMHTENALDDARREMVATVVSNVNDCYY